MSNEADILKKLVKIATNQQKILTKLAQNLDINDITTQAGNHIKNMISTWLTNNSINAKYSYSFQASEDPAYNFELHVTFSSPQANLPIVSPFPDLAGQFKAYIVKELANYPLLANKAVKVEVDTI